MQHLDEGTIHAWLDDQLPPDEAKAVEAHVAECRQCADAVAEARGLIAASSRILMSLDTVPRDVVPVPASSRTDPPRAEQRAEQRAQRRWFSGPSLAAAATIVVAVGTFALMRASNRDLTPLAGTPMARTAVSGPMADSVAATPSASAAPAPVPVVVSPAAPPPQALGSAIATVQPSGAAGAAGARAETTQKFADTKAEASAPERRAAAEPQEKQQLAAKTTAESKEKDASADRAEVTRQAVPPQQLQQIAARAARDELKKIPAPDSTLVREKPGAPPPPISVRGASALAERSNATAGRADAANVSSSTGVVRGRVTDANGTGLASAMVNVVGTAIGVPTSSTGEYTLGGIEPGTRRLRVMRVGYEAVNRDVAVVAGQSATADVVLSPTQVALNEVVVTGANAPAPAASSARKRSNAPSAETAPGAPIAASESNAVGCYELGITPTGAQARTGFRQVPRRIALDADIVPANADGVWYRARDLSRAGTLPNGLWRPAGPDAVELEWSTGTRTARVRLSGSAGSMMRGSIEEIDRATATGEAGNVVAVRRPCDG